MLPSDDPRLSLISGVDLSVSSSEQVIEALGAKVPQITRTTHVFFYAYVNDAPEGETQYTVNTRLVDNTLIALKELCPNLKHFILQTGGKVIVTLYLSVI